MSIGNVSWDKENAHIALDSNVKGGVKFSVHAAVGGFGHPHCHDQVNTVKRYGKIVFPCA